MRRKIIAPIVIGNLLEWYDFALYGFWASVISRHFFSPTASPLFATITTFFIFATGYLARPLGALFFGHIGDRYGRTASLSLSVLLMAVATTSIGLLPGYTSFGSLSTLLLLVCRLAQGFTIGGEFTVSVAYVSEHASPARRSFYGSFTMLGTFGGLLLGSLVVSLTNTLLDTSSVEQWGWRIPFMLGLPLGMVGLLLRRHLPETPEFLQRQKIDSDIPIYQLLRNYWPRLLVASGLVLFGAISFTLWFVWLPFYIGQNSTQSIKLVFLINSCNLLIILSIIPLVGYLADRGAARNWFTIGALLSFVATWPLLENINPLQPTAFWLLQGFFALSTACAYAVVPRLLYDCFPVAVRCSGISLAYNVANLLASFVPLVATILVHQQVQVISRLIPVVMLAAFISLLSLYGLAKTKSRM